MEQGAIQRWHERVNAADLEGVRNVITEQLVVSGPRGVRTITAGEFTEWVVRSGIRLEPVSWHAASEHVVVVEQQATWPETEDPMTVATVFRVTGDRVSAALRYPDLEQALAFARAYVQLAATEG